MPHEGQVCPPFLRVDCAEIWSSFQMSATVFFEAGMFGRSIDCAQISHRCCSWTVFGALAGPAAGADAAPDSGGESPGWRISVTWTVATFLRQFWQIMKTGPG